MTNRTIGTCNTTNKAVLAFVEEQARLCQPDRIHWCDGSDAEYQTLCDQMVESGTFIKLNEKLRSNSYLARSHSSDVARVCIAVSSSFTFLNSSFSFVTTMLNFAIPVF